MRGATSQSCKLNWIGTGENGLDPGQKTYAHCFEKMRRVWRGIRIEAFLNLATRILAPPGSHLFCFSPAEAREAALARKSQNADALFRNQIAEKRQAERSRNWDEADTIESEVQRLDKARIKIPSRAKP